MKKTVPFNDKDLLSLSELLKVNIPLKEALLLIENKQNHKSIEKIKNALLEGKEFEEVMLEHLKKEYLTSLKAFLKMTNFERALSLTLRFEFFKNQLIQDLKKDLSYPIFLLLVGVSALSLFDHFALPSLFSMLQNFEIDYGFIELVSKALSFCIEILLYFLIVILFFFFFLLKRKRRRFFFRLIKKMIKRSYFELYENYKFIYYYDLCTQEGISTKDSLWLLRFLKDQPIVAYFAYEIDELLSQGKSFEEALLKSSLEPHFYIYMRIALLSGNLKEMLALYLKENEKERQMKLKRLTKTIQIISYAVIALFVIFIYQVLFIPMQALNQF